MSSPDPISPVTPPTSEVVQFQSPQAENPAWNLIDVLATVAFSFVAIFIGVTLVLAAVRPLARFHNLTPAELNENAIVRVSALTIAYALIITFMVMLVRLRGRSDFLAAVSWNAPAREKAFIVVVSGVGMVLVSQALAFLVARWVPPSLPVEQFFREPVSAYWLSLFGIFVAPVVEELFFRGFLYPALARVTSIPLAITFTTLAFTMLHGAQLGYSWAALIPILAVGAILTTVRARTRSVATTVYMHMAYNTTLLGVELIVTHGFRQLSHP